MRFERKCYYSYFSCFKLTVLKVEDVTYLTRVIKFNEVFKDRNKKLKDRRNWIE